MCASPRAPPPSRTNPIRGWRALSAVESVWAQDAVKNATTVSAHESPSRICPQSLKSGSIQGAFEAPIADLPALQAASNGTVYQGKSLEVFELAVNSPGPDVKVRTALSMVINRSAMATGWEPGLSRWRVRG